jgi:hypothetical protein
MLRLAAPAHGASCTPERGPWTVARPDPQQRAAMQTAGALALAPARTLRRPARNRGGGSGPTRRPIPRPRPRTGEKGRRIRELTSVVQKRFKFAPDTVELYAEKVANRGLCAIAQAESLRYKLLGGLAVRR